VITVESKAEIFFLAWQSLSKRERKAVIAKLLADPHVREDLLDIALIQHRQGEPSRPFREYLEDRKKGA